ncbi:MAG: hypothetical protein JWL90_2093 [Chthoniobacteraceae bacterium]|nr:hypothetical protein [Chthoniobacteraceae bacterium]
MKLPYSFTTLSAALLLLASPAFATERKFAYSYEVTTAPKGSIEMENWVTWKRNKDAKLDEFSFRHELEFGVTDRLQIGVYVADWTYVDAPGAHRSLYDGSAVEIIYNLTNPTTSFLGSALYGEVHVGENSFSLEGKLLLQKNFGPFTVAYNAIVEGEWEGEDLHHLDERSGELAQSLGVSYQVTPHFLVGAELLHEVDLPDWSSSGSKGIFFAGPNASVRAGRFYATAAVLFQATDLSDEPDVQTRLIVGFTF